MLGLVPLAAALALTAGQLDLTATVSAETRAGETPIVNGQPPERSLMAIAIPGVFLEYRAPRLSLQAQYQVRIFWRTAENEPMVAPLYLHTFGLSLASRETRRLSTKLAATAFEGSADYTFLPVIFGTTQAALVTVPRIFSATLAGDAQWQATRRLTPGIAVNATHNEPLGPPQVISGTSGMTTTYNLPHYTSATMSPDMRLRLSPVAEGSLGSVFTYEHVSGLNQAFLTPTGGVTAGNQVLSLAIVAPTLATTLHTSRLTSLQLKLGVAFTHFFSGAAASPDAVTPNGGVDVRSTVFTSRQTALDLSGTAAVDYYVDPVLAIAAPRASAAASSQLRFATDWTIALQGTFSTSLSAHASPAFSQSYPDLVSASLSLPIRHPLSEHAVLEFGGRWADRSPFFTAPNFGFHQRQLWVYVLLTGTSHGARTAVSAAP
jgi:hypothetical protein